MSTKHRMAMICDGCDLVIETIPDKYPTLILELSTEGWVFQCNVYANIVHRDFCPTCIENEIDKIMSEQLKGNGNESI
jgi:hypothetical protein